MKQLHVIYEGWGECFELGRLADDGRQILFEYSETALARGLQLSPLRLPLQAGAAGNFPRNQLRLPGLVSDSLPDGWGKLLTDRLFRRRGVDLAQVSPLDRLAMVGRRGMGALTYQPESEDPFTVAGVELADLADDVHEFEVHDSEAVLQALLVVGGSPHGARPKALVNIDTVHHQMWNDEAAPGIPWLVKFPAMNEHPEVCAVEAMYADLVHEASIAMPPTTYFDLGKAGAAFGIERFDRHDGLRVPTHTVAGAAHVDFRAIGGMDYANFLRLTGYVCNDVREVERAFERCVFNVVFNNRDDHCKNFSYRMEPTGQWRLSPAYDVTFNPGPNGEHQMDIGGEAKAPRRSHLMSLAKAEGVSPRVAETIIDRTCEVAGQLAAAASRYPIRASTVNEILGVVEKNRSRMRP